MTIKTMQGWHNSPHSTFSDYAKPNDQIDEEIYWYFLEVLPPIYYNYGVFQVGEAYDHNSDGKPRYSTFKTIKDLDKQGEVIEKYFYLGNMTVAEAKKYSKIAF